MKVYAKYIKKANNKIRVILYTIPEMVDGEIETACIFKTDSVGELNYPVRYNGNSKVTYIDCVDMKNANLLVDSIRADIIKECATPDNYNVDITDDVSISIKFKKRSDNVLNIIIKCNSISPFIASHVDAKTVFVPNKNEYITVTEYASPISEDLKDTNNNDELEIADIDGVNEAYEIVHNISNELRERLTNSALKEIEASKESKYNNDKEDDNSKRSDVLLMNI